MASHQVPQRIALITGAAKGIGASIADVLAQQGMHVLIGDIDETQARTKAEALTGAGHTASALRIDVGDPASITSAFEIIDQRYRPLRYRGEQRRHSQDLPFVDFPLDSWQAHLTINLTGALLCAQAGARRMMRERWGRIINIASVAGMRAVGAAGPVTELPRPLSSDSPRQMAVELAEHGITANAVAPGPVDTPMTKVLHSPEFRQSYTDAIPMNRYGTPRRLRPRSPISRRMALRT
jgi:NAD(P)-dependent dehydrogenase (short-subunit alcohol dehydrogenase family)